MRLKLTHLAGLLIAGCALCSCQPAPEEAPPTPPVVMDYTLLGIWHERFHASEVSMALKEAGIPSRMSGWRPCLLNVETARLAEARDIVAANPKWRETRIR